MKQTHPTILRWIGIASTLGTLTLLISVSYFLLTGPEFPYRYSIAQVDRILNPADAGALQPGDILLTLNGKTFLGCWYFVDSPAYTAPRGIPIPLTYWRAAKGAQGPFNLLLKTSMPWSLFPARPPVPLETWLPADGVKGTTQIVLRNPSPGQLLNW